MRKGYVIKDRNKRGWFCTRHRPEAGEPVTVYVKNPDDAMQWNRLADARKMLKLLRSESTHPNAILIIDPKWRIVC